jgi:hypothetical protein
MFERFNNLSGKEWNSKIQDIVIYLLRKWWLLLLSAVVFGVAGYIFSPKVTTSYTATFSFVLSTETKSSGFSGLASQFGLEVGTGGSENIFSGDNIIELFKSRKMVSAALMRKIDSNTNLLTYITRILYPEQAKTILPFPDSIDHFNAAQKNIFTKISAKVAKSFTVFKKDKKLIFYVISATSPYEDIAYYVAKYMLDQTSSFFIETKVKVATRSLELLQGEADSLASLLGNMFSSTAAMTDRSFNINPSIMSQRSGTQLNLAKTTALAAAYTEVMKNLEIAKINVQKETPLFQVIDDPVLPLSPESSDTRFNIYYSAALGFIIMVLVLSLVRLWKTTPNISEVSIPAVSKI